jgi:hypothetical protein
VVGVGEEAFVEEIKETLDLAVPCRLWLMFRFILSAKLAI